MSNVIDMPNPMSALVERIKAAHERTVNGRKEWIEGALEFAATLAEARARFPSDIALGVWLAQNELDWLGKENRAALLGMAEDLNLTRTILEEAKSASFRVIWREEVEPSLHEVAKDVKTLYRATKSAKRRRKGRPSSQLLDPLAHSTAEPPPMRSIRPSWIRTHVPLWAKLLRGEGEQTSTI